MASDLLKNDQTCENPEQNHSDDEGKREKEEDEMCEGNLSQTNLMEQANRRAWTRKNPEQNPRKHKDPPL